MPGDNAMSKRNTSVEQLPSEYYDEKNLTSRESSIGAPENVLKAQMFMMSAFMAQDLRNTVVQNAREHDRAEKLKKEKIANIIQSLAVPR